MARIESLRSENGRQPEIGSKREQERVGGSRRE